MKKICALLLLCFLSFQGNGQTQTTPSVEKSIYGVQIGAFGIWGHSEKRLSNAIALRVEAGLDASLFISGNSNNNLFFLTPVFTVEPRWYYNLEKRISKSRNINNNSGNFVGLKTSFNPDWFVISDVENITVHNQIFIIPKWGIKRTLGQHFTYEAGIGLGYFHDFYKDNWYNGNEKNGIAVDIHFRIGYTF